MGRDYLDSTFTYVNTHRSKEETSYSSANGYRMARPMVFGVRFSLIFDLEVIPIKQKILSIV